jgi:outer membrane receptor protein involved in Fe transport
MGNAKSRGLRAILVGIIFVTAVVLIGYGATAMAQEQQQQQPQEQQQPAAQEEQPAEEFKEEVVVTGTLIPRPTLEAMSPVSTLEVEELTYRGLTRMEDLLTSLPQVFASQNAIVANGTSGTATVNLRNLGEVRTLTLIDGRRMASGDSGAPGADLNFIPAALVKRVDLLTGGASAVYGADAVAGVVNFVMDREFEGVRGGIQFAGFNHDNNNDLVQSINAAKGFDYPSGSAWDGNTLNANVALGGKFAEGRGHGVLYLDYRDAKEVLKSARDYTNCSVAVPGDEGPWCSGSSTTDSGRFSVYNATTGRLHGDYKVDGTSWVPRSGYVWNFAPYNHLQRPDTRWVAGGFLNYDFNENVEGYLEVGYMNDYTEGQIAPSGDFYGNTFLLNYDNPMLSDQQRGILAAAGWGPGDIADVTIGRRSVETGGRQYHIEHNQWRFIAGLKGDLGKAWSYDVNGLLAQVSTPESFVNDFNINNIQNALLVEGDPNDPSTWQCMDANARAAGCVPWNVFSTGGVTQEQTDWLTLDLLEESGTSTKIVTGNLRGDLGEYGLTIPSASEGIQFAFGADYGVFGMYYRPDQANQDGIAAGRGGTAAPVDASYDVTEVYAEMLIPLIQDVTGFRDLSLELGYRYSDYSTSGGWPTYKAQASWAPGAGLKFRAGFNRATRSANAVELFSPQAIGLGGSTDPCAGEVPDATFEQCARTGVTADQYGFIEANPAGQYSTQTGGNPLLNPEVADTISYGLVFTPTGSSFTAAIDYYKIEVDDTIGALRADDTISACLETGVLCDLIHRDRFGSLWIVQGEGYTEATNQNIGALVSEGIDLNLSWLLPTGNSFFNFTLTGTYLLTNETDTGMYAYDCVGYFGDLCNNFYGVAYGLTPDWRHLARVSWETGPIVLSLGWRYLSEMMNQAASDNPHLADPESQEMWELNGSWKIPATNYFDLAFSWKLMDGIQLTLGVNNILDEEPPLGSGIDNYDYGPGFWGAYDVYGRYLFSGIQFAL